PAIATHALALHDALPICGIEVRSHMSSLKEAEEKLLRETFDKDKNMKNEKKEEGRTEAKPKKKSNIIQVFRPQNAKTPEGKNLGDRKSTRLNSSHVSISY